MAFFREKPRVDIADFALRQVSWLPGQHRFSRTFPDSLGLEWFERIEKRLAGTRPSGSPSSERDVGGGLAGYSGGTAQVFDLLPFYPPFMEAP